MKRGVKSVFITFTLILTIFITFSLIVNADIFNNGLDAGLVSYWSFNGSANDNQGSYDGNVTGNVTLVNSCISGQAYSFDGTGHINCGKSLPSTGVITISAWVNFTQSQHAAIAGKFVAETLILNRTGNDSFIINNTNLLAVFTDTGDIELKGSCVLTFCGSGIFEIYNSGIVASINSTGDLCLESGDCNQDSSCSAGSLTIKNASGTVVSSINSSGGLCYIGNLIQNGFN